MEATPIFFVTLEMVQPPRYGDTEKNGNTFSGENRFLFP